MRNKTIVGIIIFVCLLLSAPGSAVLAQDSLTVMTWNVHGGNPAGSPGSNCSLDNIPHKSLRKFVDQIRAYNRAHKGHHIDVIAVQEIHRNQAKELANMLQDSDIPQTKPYGHFFPTRRCTPIGKGDPNPYHAHPREDTDYGSVIIVTRLKASASSKAGLTVSDPKHYFLVNDSKDFAAHHEYTILAALTINLSGSRAVRIYNTHLIGDNSSTDAANYKAGKKGPWIGESQVVDANEKIFRDDQNYRGRKPFLLMGDFNFHPPSSPYRAPYMARAYARLKSFGYQDAWEEWTGGNKPPFGFTVGGADDYNKAYKRIDYIVWKNRPGKVDDFKVNYAKVPDTGNISDHFPVVAQLTLQ
jgi:endonuclease/exonuclease/phosphatase family metal-dependent hydrolase